MPNKKIDKTEKPEAEYGLDSRYSSKQARKIDGKALMEARLNRLNNYSEAQIVQAKLLQLKLKMEDFIDNPVENGHNFFTAFLKLYIDTIYDKRVHFASDINVTPVFLSQVLNNHREPKEEFILRLMVHSEKTFEKIGAFDKKTWFQVYFHEKIHETMSKQDKWRPEIEKHVTVSQSSKAL